MSSRYGVVALALAGLLCGTLVQGCHESSGGGFAPPASQGVSNAPSPTGSSPGPAPGPVPGSSQATTGVVRILIHDAPTPAVDQVWITFDEVSVHSEADGWMVLSNTPQTLDLLALQDGVVAELGLDVLPAGSYGQIRLHIADAWVVLPSGDSEPLTIPSGGTSGLKIGHGFEVPAGGRVTITLDWDAGAHLKHNKGKGWMLRPVIDVSVEQVAGASGVLDANGDGRPDVLLQAAPENASLLAYFGTASGLPATPQQTLVVPPPAGAHGMGSGLNLGDINGDGATDIMVRRDFDGQGLHIHLGGPSGFDPTRFQHLTNPLGPVGLLGLGGRFGGNPAVGDVDGDGVRDLATSARGMVWLLKGTPTSGFDPTPIQQLLHPDDPGNTLYAQGVSLGDVNGDDHADLVVSNAFVSGFQGRVWVYLGGPAGVAPTPSFSIPGPTSDHDWGARVEASEDYDGDGFDDIVVAATRSGAGSRGVAYVYRGSAAGPVATPIALSNPDPAAYYSYGEYFRSVGDFTGNGHPDLAISARGIGPVGDGPGSVSIFEGGPGGPSATPVAILAADPPDPITTRGRWIPQVVGCGDLNGDSRTEVLVLTESFGLRYPARVYAGGTTGPQSTPLQVLDYQATPTLNLSSWMIGFEAAVDR